MQQSTKSPPQTNSHLRVVRDEDAPPYDPVPSPKLAGGFAMIPAKVFELNDGAAIAVYAILAKHADKEGVCWPSMKRLEESLGWTEFRIRPAIKVLIDAGLVTIEKRKFRGMDQANLYRLQASVRVPSSKVAVPSDKVLGTQPQGTGYLATRHEQEPIELNTKELDVPANAGKEKKPLPQNGIAQQIVAAYCKEAGIDAPAVYGKAVGLAKQIANAGVTVEDIPSLYAFAAEWKGTADLGLMLNQIDRWRAKPKAISTNGRAPKLPEDIQRRIDRWLEESRELGLERPMAPSIIRDVEAWKQAQHIGSLT